MKSNDQNIYHVIIRSKLHIPFDFFKTFSRNRPPKVPLDKRHYPTRNFYVQVFKKNDFSQCVYCKSCSMDTVSDEYLYRMKYLRIFLSKDLIRSDTKAVNVDDCSTSVRYAWTRNLSTRRYPTGSILLRDIKTSSFALLKFSLI